MMHIAIDLAKNNSVKYLPKMGAVIARRSKLISTGKNSRKTDPLQFRYSKHPLAICKHAEIDAIKNALRKGRKEDLKGSTIFIARVLSDGTTSIAKPCEGCIKAIKAYGIANVFYT